MDVCYVSYLYFRAEIANYIENLYFVVGKLCKNIANNQKYWLITWFIDNIERGAPFVYFKIYRIAGFTKSSLYSSPGVFYLSGLPNNFSIKLLGPLFSVFLAR